MSCPFANFDVSLINYLGLETLDANAFFYIYVGELSFRLANLGARIMRRFGDAWLGCMFLCGTACCFGFCVNLPPCLVKVLSTIV